MVDPASSPPLISSTISSPTGVVEYQAMAKLQLVLNKEEVVVQGMVVEGFQDLTSGARAIDWDNGLPCYELVNSWSGRRRSTGCFG